MNELRITVTNAGEVVVATLHGDLDLMETDRAAETLMELGGSSADGLVVDLDSVNYVDSSGVRMLFALARELDTRRRSLAFVLNDASPLCRLFKVTGLDEVVPREPSLADALSRLQTA